MNKNYNNCRVEKEKENDKYDEFAPVPILGLYSE
jgi:hypothetical protein